MRRTLEEAGVGYVLAVPKSQQLHAPFGRIDQAIADASDEERGAAETTPPAPSTSPWQKSADSWTLCCPAPHPSSAPLHMP